jgi:hypothetical protein
MSTTSSASSSRNATRRLIKELETWHNVESQEERGIERLGPVHEGELLAWEAVVNGRGVGAGYDGSFSTSLCHTYTHRETALPSFPPLGCLSLIPLARSVIPKFPMANPPL